MVIWKYRKTFEKKIMEWFNLGEDHDNKTETFIKIFLEHDDENEEVTFAENGTHIYPACFAYMYVRVKTNHNYRFDLETWAYGTRVHYP